MSYLKSTTTNMVANDNYTAKVYWNSEWQEYQVRLFVNGIYIKAATYHTDWAEDAIGTARAMCKLPPLTEI